MVTWKTFGCIVATLMFHGVATLKNETNQNFRQKKLFSIFSIVSFRNNPCTTIGASNLGGTCLTSSSCSAKGGFASGNCASGFGVCCVFRVSGACGTAQTITENCTYIQNNGFPSADAMADETCTYRFRRICDNLCQIRLDFNTLATLVETGGTCGGAFDAINVVSPFSPSPNAFPPTLCGTLTGQHMYFETGSTEDAGTLEIVKGTTDGNRNYEIKVTYLTCDNLAKAPAGCTQYFTALSGSFQSYNHAGGQLLEEMNYSNCFRQREGYCRLQLQESSSMNPDPFGLSLPAAAAETDCIANSFVSFSTPTTSMFCGDIFNSVDGDTEPGVVTSAPGSSFMVGVLSLVTALDGFSGFNFDFTQVPCT